MRLMYSKLLMASPRNAGVKDMVKSLNRCRFSPNSTPSILLTIFNNATLAQAFSAVCHGHHQLFIHLSHDLKSTNLVGKPKPFWTACFLFPRIIFLPTKKENQAVDGFAARPCLSIKECSQNEGQKRHQRPGTPYCRKAIISSSNDTTSCTLAPLTPKSRSIALNRAWSPSEQSKPTPLRVSATYRLRFNLTEPIPILGLYLCPWWCSHRSIRFFLFLLQPMIEPSAFGFNHNHRQPVSTKALAAYHCRTLEI